MVLVFTFQLFSCVATDKLSDTSQIQDVSDIDADGDGYTGTEDCDDNDDAIYPGAVEICDSIDNNCDELIDENVLNTYFEDVDGDGFGNPDQTTDACEAPLGYVEYGTDCDDSEDTAFPGGSEICDGIDNNCDEIVDNDGSGPWFLDEDGDGYGATRHDHCPPSEQYVTEDGDCDDQNPAVYPEAEEVCDELDNDCDGDIDEELGTMFYGDVDSDQYGDPEEQIIACTQPQGTSTNPNDCDDLDSNINPGATEYCDYIDNNCNGVVDEETAADAQQMYIDADIDGYGDPQSPVFLCFLDTGFSLNDSDCDDSNAAVNPVALEYCNSIDDNCNSVIDEDSAEDTSTWYIDGDTDGYGNANLSLQQCDQPTGYVLDDSDCDDGDIDINTDATEVCDGVDNDCNGAIDDDDLGLDTTTGTDFYLDDDGDGFGDPTVSSLLCALPSGYSASNTDCDDTNDEIFPGATLICGVDADCDGVTEDTSVAEVRAGSLTDEQHYQYSDVGSGLGVIHANWDSAVGATEYMVAVGTTPGGEDVFAYDSVGAVTATSISGLSLEGAWTGAEYYVSIRPVIGQSCQDSASQKVQIAEGILYTGDASELRPNDADGGAHQDWPESGMDSVFGAHYFESVAIASGTEITVQGWGKEDAVSAGVSASSSAVQQPADGWLALYANDISIEGTITASGRGYGAGGGGGGGPQGPAGYRGQGGSNGLGGTGGSPPHYDAGGGGGGSPGGSGGGVSRGGNGNIYGGGSGATGCSGSAGRNGGDGSVGTVGSTGGTASSGSPGFAGTGEFSPGGGYGVSGCDSWSGGGGGGYGAGGGGGSQWSASDSGGGGGGGTGGSGGGTANSGGNGAGLFGGSGGGANSSSGQLGGYQATSSNGDSSSDRSLYLGSGGGGGGSGAQEAGGGGGGAGGGAILLYAYDALSIASSAKILANGAGGGGGARDNGGNATSHAGGDGAGGTIVLEGGSVFVDTSYISALGGSSRTSNGGSIKYFYDSFSGTNPSSAGYTYDAGQGSWTAP